MKFLDINVPKILIVLMVLIVFLALVSRVTGKTIDISVDSNKGRNIGTGLRGGYVAKFPFSDEGCEFCLGMPEDIRKQYCEGKNPLHPEHITRFVDI